MVLLLSLGCALPTPGALTGAPSSEKDGAPPPSSFDDELGGDDTAPTPTPAAGWCYLAAVDPQGPNITALDELDLSTGVVTWIGAGWDDDNPVPQPNGLVFDGERWVFGGDAGLSGWYAFGDAPDYHFGRITDGPAPASLAWTGAEYVVASGAEARVYSDLAAPTPTSVWAIDAGERVSAIDADVWLLAADGGTLRAVDDLGVEISRFSLDSSAGAPVAFATAGEQALVLVGSGAAQSLATFSVIDGARGSVIPLQFDALTAAKVYGAMWCAVDRFSWM